MLWLGAGDRALTVVLGAGLVCSVLLVANVWRQELRERPGIYAPYQPRFDWKLWIASLGPWQQSSWVVLAQERLVEGSPSVLRLFRNDPFHGRPPAMVRTVLCQYWFTHPAVKRATGAWWRRTELGLFKGIVGDAGAGTLPASLEPSRTLP